MKVSKIAVSLLLFSTSIISGRSSSCDCEGTGISYLAVRQHFLSASPERVAGFRNERIYAKKNGYHGAFQAVVFGSKSTDEEALARYFTPFCKLNLIVDERSESDVTQDLLAANFNIFTINGDFRSKIRFRPRHSTVGVGLQYRQSFWKSKEKGRGLWFSAAAPISRVNNSMQLCENVINDGGGPDLDANSTVVSNMKEAFVQSDWCFGKIDCKSHTKAGVAFVELKVGYEWLQHEPYHLESYLGVLLPTGNKPNGVYVFEPVVGNGGHFGATFGSAIGFQIWDDEKKDRHLRVEYANNTKYLFKKTHKRSFDLRNKPYTRYITVYKSKAQAQEAADLATTNMLFAMNLATPGINVFTLDAEVTPGIAHTINTAFVFTSGGFQAEAGYNFYAQSSECIKLKCPFPDGIALKETFMGEGITNRVRDITGNFILEVADNVSLADYNESVLTEKDLDLTSAATPCLLSHTIFAALGYRWDKRDYPPSINGGVSYEFSHATKAVMERWTVWFKGGLSF